MQLKLCQLRPKLGGIKENLSRLKTIFVNAKETMVIFPELYLSGYPPFDCLMYDEFSNEINTAIDECRKITKGSDKLLIIGAPRHIDGNWYNSAYAFSNGECIYEYDKQCLPNYDIFNESRYFIVGDRKSVFEWNGKKFALFICEDIWVDHVDVKYHKNPILDCKGDEIELIIHISASPFENDKLNKRFDILKQTALSISAPIVSVNQVGAYNDIIFDGQSLILNREGMCIFKGNKFEEGLISFDINHNEIFKPKKESLIQEMYNAVIFGLQEYCKYSGFKQVLVGVSGGIDSAVVAALAVAACGKENVICVSMPTQYNSEATKNDAKDLVENLGCQWLEFSIESFRETISKGLGGLIGVEHLGDITEQNIQARLRGFILMSLSNEYNALLLTTGNKSELAMGYATLYGDMCGGLNIIGDIFKTDIFALAKTINFENIIIPETIINRAPSAELAPNQRDEDSLPQYEKLDQILKQYIIEKKSLNELVNLNDKEDVMLVMSKLNSSEFKRFQSPPILKLSSRAFGRGWQYPIIK